MTDPLFSSSDLGSVLTRQEKTLSDEIGSLNEDRILNTSPEDLRNYFVEKYSVESLEIDESNIQADYGDAQVDISQRVEYAVFDRSGPTYITGTRLTFYVPFTGDPNLFKCRPSSFSLNPPRAIVGSGELVFVYDRTTRDAPNVKTEFERDKDKVKRYLQDIASSVAQFNSAIEEKVSKQITARREKLLQDRGLIENFGFPLKCRENVSATYIAPEVKRRIVPQLPPVSAKPYRPEPALGMAEYEYVLSILANMVMVIERSPKAFKGMGEEDLRTHFLVQLNGHYEGQATGETFNYEGKTDILIRVDGKNIFIAECKFWRGPSELKDALDQLLGYTTWRDTKTALLIFNRNRDMTSVLGKIPEVVRQHPGYKSEREYDSETGFRFVFGHRDDDNREIILTVLAFDVPE